MKAITAEWVAKAEGDLDMGLLGLRSRKSLTYDAVCFHAQQCAEKYLKAVFVEEGVAFPKTHDLRSLLNLMPDRGESWEALRPSLVDLSDAAVTLRYPGETSDREAAKNALATARRVRALARKRLRLSK
jgi:HEPN domain-containing protein